MITDKDKLDSETALAKIKVLINKRYEDMGRGYSELNNLDEEIIDDIDEILNNANIDIKRIIIERLKLDTNRDMAEKLTYGRRKWKTKGQVF